MSRLNLSFRSMVVLAAMREFIKKGDYDRIADSVALKGAEDIRLESCKQLVDICYLIGDLMDAEGKKRHASDQRVQEAGR